MQEIKNDTFYKCAMGLVFILPLLPYYHGNGATGLSASDMIRGVLSPSLVLSSVMLFQRLRERNQMLPGQGQALIAIPLLLWFAAATWSTAVNFGTERVLVNYVAAYVAMILLYLAFANLRISVQTIVRVLASLLVGATVPSIAGIAVFVSVFGAPTPELLLSARWQVDNFRAYQDATFGSLGNMASFITLVVPVFIVQFFETQRSNWLRFGFLAVTSTLLLNLLMIQQRGAMIALVMALLLILLFFRRAVPLVSLGILALVLFMLVPEMLANFYWDRISQALDVEAARDSSVIERLSAMNRGIEIFWDNWAAGVGPSATYLHNQYGTAHQVIIEQAAQLGFMGALAIIFLNVAISIRLMQLIWTGASASETRLRFTFAIGPFTYLFYGLIANVTINITIINTWICLFAIMLGLTDARYEDRAAARRMVPSRLMPFASARRRHEPLIS